MKRFILTMFIAVVALGVFSATGNAQVHRQYSAKIPFDFSVGKKQFKAGDYRIGPLGAQTSADFLVLTERSTGRVQILGQVLVNKDEPELNGVMQFVKSGDQWVLSSIETGTFSVALSKKDLDGSKIALNRDPSGSKTIGIQ